MTWKNKKHLVSRSSAEAEFCAMAQEICELMWSRGILKELKMETRRQMKLCCDNNSAISIAHNLVQHDRTKHVEVDKHFIKEKLDNKLICTPFVTSKNQLADMLTKGVDQSIFHNITCKLVLKDIYSPT